MRKHYKHVRSQVGKHDQKKVTTKTKTKNARAKAKKDTQRKVKTDNIMNIPKKKNGIQYLYCIYSRTKNYRSN